MIKCLYNLQSGFVNPYKFNQSEVTKRCYSLQLSRHQDVESVHTSGVNSLDIERSENRYLLSGCADGSIYIHDINNLTGRPHYTAKCICKVVKNSDCTHRYSVECVSWYGCENALFITSGSERTLKIWDANSLKSIVSFQSKGRIFHHDCSFFYTSSPVIAVASSVNFVELIDLRTGGKTHELRGHKSSVLTCCWSPTQEYLLSTGGLDKAIYLWDVRSSNSCLKAFQDDSKETAHSGYVNGLKFTSDGLFLVSMGTDSKIKLWNTLSGRKIKIDYGEIKNDVKKHIQFAISNNSKPCLLYIPSEGNIFVIEIASGKLVNILNGHFHSINCCFYRETYQELYSGGNDRNVLLWSADEPQREAYLESNKSDDECLNKKSRTMDDAWSSDEN